MIYFCKMKTYLKRIVSVRKLTNTLEILHNDRL